MTTVTVNTTTTITANNETIRQVGSSAETLTVDGNNDSLIASNGADQLVANGTSDTLRAGSGGDVLTATGDNATLIGGSGAGQQLAATGDFAVITGGSGANQILTANGNSATITGGNGAGQQMTANGNNALVTSGSGADQVLTVNGNNSTLVGQASGDTLTAFGNGETLTAGGNETLTVFGNNSALTGGGGTESLSAFGNNDVLTAQGPSCTPSGGQGCGDDGSWGRGSGQGGASCDPQPSSCGSNNDDGHSSWSGGCDPQPSSCNSSNSGRGGWQSAGWAGSNNWCDANDSRGSQDSCDTQQQSWAGGFCNSDQSFTANCGDQRSDNGCDDSSNGGSCSPYFRTELDDCYDQSVACNFNFPQQSLLAQGNNDTLVGGRGSDTIEVDGNNSTVTAGTLGSQTLLANGNFDTLTGGGWSDNITANGNSDTLTAGQFGSQTLVANGNNDTLTGGGWAGNLTANGFFDTLTAGAFGQQTLTANGENDTLVASSNGATKMADTWDLGSYQVALGDGPVAIANGSVDNGGPANTLAFGTGISDEQLWFQQSGNDLNIDVMGTQQNVTVSDWFGGTTDSFAQLQTVSTADGNSLDNSQVSQLVQAMATFSTDNPGFDPTSPGNSQAPNDPGVQGAIAAAWQASA